MQPDITWQQIALRLCWTVVAGVLIGMNREEHGRAVGLRTTLLVCLAASVSMIQVNLLLPLAGKTPDSFVVMDLMRLPLGILSGMGFIGAGAILRRENLVLGVTTAATLWFVTVLGLCFGGGQISLGIVALVLGFLILTGLKWFEHLWKQDRTARLDIVTGARPFNEADFARSFSAEGYRLRFLAMRYDEHALLRELNCEVRWRGRRSDTEPPAFLKTLAHRFGLQKLEWRIAAGH